MKYQKNLGMNGEPYRPFRMGPVLVFLGVVLVSFFTFVIISRMLLENPMF